eukprot:Gb_12012 [translate_table: standard]
MKRVDGSKEKNVVQYGGAAVCQLTLASDAWLSKRDNCGCADPLVEERVQKHFNICEERDPLNVSDGQLFQDPGTSTSPQLPSSSEKSSTSPAPPGEANESDDDVRRVPEMGSQGEPSTYVHVKAENPQTSSGVSQRKRGRTPADKEHKRLKRLLRNRVSAQQARERKKAYLNELETRAKELEQRNSELEERVSTLHKENHMLRQRTCSPAESGSDGTIRMFFLTIWNVPISFLLSVPAWVPVKTKISLPLKVPILYKDSEEHNNEEERSGRVIFSADA